MVPSVLTFWWPNHSNSTWLYNHKIPNQIFSALFHEVYYLFTHFLTKPCRIPEKNHATSFLAVCKDKLPKVFVFRQQNFFFTKGKMEYFHVFRPWGYFGNSRYFIPGATKGPNNREVTTFIRKETHNLFLSQFLF